LETNILLYLDETGIHLNCWFKCCTATRTFKNCDNFTGI